MLDALRTMKVFGIVTFITGTVWVAAWERGLYDRAQRGYLPAAKPAVVDVASSRDVAARGDLIAADVAE
jgi:hypothetical protein